MRSIQRRWLLGTLLVLSASFTWGCGKDKAPKEKVQAATVSQEKLAELTKGSELEKTELKLGFIKLTDCAPLVIAKEQGFFDDEGLNVTLEAQANWKVLLDRVISGELDGAHMLAGQPIGATIGFGTKAHVVTAFSMDLNGNGITVSNELWKEMQKNDPALNSATPPHPISAAALKPIVSAKKKQRSEER